MVVGHLLQRFGVQGGHWGSGCTWTSKVPRIRAHVPLILGALAIILGTLEVPVRVLRGVGPFRHLRSMVSWVEGFR